MPCCASRFPRSEDRGLIEAPDCRRKHAATQLHFRDPRIAASLKPGDCVHDGPEFLHFRDPRIAASLKHWRRGWREVRFVDFRDPRIAASLKQPASRPRAQPGRCPPRGGRGLKRFRKELPLPGGSGADTGEGQFLPAFVCRGPGWKVESAVGWPRGRRWRDARWFLSPLRGSHFFLDGFRAFTHWAG